MPTNELITRPVHELAAETTTFQSYLSEHGLPTENIIADWSERVVVGENLPTLLDSLPPELKRDARYLSKFVGATAIGLFDAALNYVWNEVVLNLRDKASTYGIDLFFDAAVGGSARSSYKNEDDLPGIKDRVLLDTCRKLELISDVVYRKLDHILTMRNEVAASHPNVGAIGGYELLGWLQTCVRDVIQDQLSDSAIRIKSLVANLKASTDLLDQQTVECFNGQVRHLSLPHIQNLTLTIFALYTSPDTGSTLRANIAKIAPAVWQAAPESIKYRVGAKIDGYRTNLEQDRLSHGTQFLDLVGGHRFETVSARLAALTTLSQNLSDAHHEYDNYYKEPPVMQSILKYCDSVDDIPEGVLPTLVTAVVRCRIGNGTWYRDGVSPGARPLYDQFIGLLNERGVVAVLQALTDSTINHRLRQARCIPHATAVLQIARARVVSDRLRECIDMLLAKPNSMNGTLVSRDYRERLAPLLQ